MGQLSFFSAEARQPCVGDLAGLLCGPGRALGFARGRAARVSVGVDTRDRAVAVAAALAERDVQARAELVRVEPVRVEAPEPDPEPDATEPDATEPDAPEFGEPEFTESEFTESGFGEEVPGTDVPELGVDDPVDDLGDELSGEPLDDEVDGFQPFVIGSGRSAPVEPEPEPDRPEFIAEDSTAAEPTAEEPNAPPEPEPEISESWQVTTPFRADLAALAAQWFDGARKVVPPDFTLDGGTLRLWALTSGRWVESGSGYLLGLDPAAPDTHETLRKALATSGLPSTLLTDKAGGPALRVVGRRRLERLAELVGRAPSGVAERTWPAA